MLSLVKKIKDSQLLYNTLWAFSGQGMRSVVLAAYFVLIARLLGSEGYGAFVGVLALVGILSPFSSLGSGNLLVKNVSREPDVFAKYWGASLVMVVISGTVLFLLTLAISSLLLPETVPLSLVATIALAELLFARVHDICGQAFQAFQRLDKTATIQLSLNVCRLITVACLGIFADAYTPVQWGYWYLFSTVASTVFAATLVVKLLGRPTFSRSGHLSELKEGFYFCVSQSAQGIYNDIDKTMLARLAALDAAGIYSAAYRIIDVSFTPVRSLLFAAYARFFQHGRSGLGGSLGFALKLLPAATALGLFLCLLLYLVAPVVPFLLGAEYEKTVSAIRLLSVIPLLRSLHYFAADALTGAGLQGTRSLIQFSVALFNVAINFWLIPLYSWRGAALASLASDTLLAILLWAMIAAKLYKVRRNVQYA